MVSDQHGLLGLHEGEWKCEGSMRPTPRDVELAAMKGMRRRSWPGPAWLNAITGHGQVQLLCVT